MQKTFRLFLAASALVLLALWLAHWSKIRALNSGEVHMRPQTTTSPSTDAANQPAAPQELASNSAAPIAPSLGHPQNNIAAQITSEPLSSNPPSGIIASGSGKFQLYRQGDLTFRLNTETGDSCVLFATDAQWRKPLVYDHGCASH